MAIVEPTFTLGQFQRGINTSLIQEALTPAEEQVWDKLGRLGQQLIYVVETLGGYMWHAYCISSGIVTTASSLQEVISRQEATERAVSAQLKEYLALGWYELPLN